jgi:8-oxo-dGTP pyrophosphatase MutT (NUDIX family)
MRPRRIEPGWRYTLGQWVLRLLFGRRWHHISPWAMAGVGAGLVVIWNGKALIHQRRGPIERVGTWGFNGGYLELTQHETFTQGLAREVFEETGLRIDPASLGTPYWVAILYNQSKIMMANHTGVACWFAVKASKNILPLVRESDEAHNFKWATLAEIETLHQQGQLASMETYQAFTGAFAHAKTAPLPTLRLLA